MNVKKINWLFFVLVITYIGIAFWISYFPLPFSWNFISNSLLSELMIVVPTVLFLFATKTNPIQLCRMKRTHVSTLLMTVLFVFLSTPLITLVNAISLLFVDNTVLDMSSQFMDMPFIVVFFMIAIWAPITEEFVCRGVIFQGYKRQGNLLKSVLQSAFIFALLHRNFNQAGYAFVIGIALALLLEASDSFWTVFLVHCCVNGSSVINLYLLKLLPNDMIVSAMEEAASYETEQMILVISVYLLLSVIFTPIAVCVLVWIAKREGRLQQLKEIWTSRKNKQDRYITIPFVLAVLLSLGIMILETMQ